MSATTSEPVPAFGATARPGAKAVRRIYGIDWFELGVFTVFVVVSAWPIALNLFYAAAHHLVWTRIDGEFPIDQMQYLAWIRDAAHHVLVSDMFTSRGSPHDYLQPLVAISGGLAAAGVVPWLALLVWKPIAIAAVLVAVSAYCRALLPGRWQRRAALALGLFGGSLTLGNEWLPFGSWGYPSNLIGFAALVSALLAYDQGVRRKSISWSAALLGALAGWLHPWQGELLILMVVGSELVRLRLGARGLWQRVAAPAVTVASAALPLIYYWALEHFDPAWQRGHLASQRPFSLPQVLWPFLPLLIAAVPAYFRRPRSFLAVATRIWPVAAIAVWALNATRLGSWSLYAWIGIAVPLGVLAVEGVGLIGFGRIPRHRLLGALAVAALTIAPSVSLIMRAPGWIRPDSSRPNLISHDEQRALSYLAHDPAPGVVLSPYPIGDLIPGETGRRSFVGDNRWSANYNADQSAAWELLHGWLKTDAARAFVRSTGARFIVADCASRSLARTLAPMITSARHFGCITVYAVR